MKKKEYKILIGFGVAIVIVLGMLGYQYWSSSHFPKGSEIFGLDISQKSKKEVYEELNELMSKKSVKITDDNKSTEFKLSLVTKYDDSIVDNYFETGKVNIDVDEKKVSELIDGLVTNNNKVAPKDAFVHNDNGKLSIVPEEAGTLVDIEKLKEGTVKTIKEAKGLKVNTKDYLVQPKVKKDSKELKEEMKKIEAMMELDVTLLIEGNEVKVDKGAWKQAFVDGGLNNESLVKMLQPINDQYKTKGKEFEFTTHDGKKKTFVNDIEYSWEIDLEKTAQGLMNAANSSVSEHKESFGMEVSVLGNGYGDKGQLGGNYVEVDLNDQHAYIFKDGKKVFDWPVITGMPPKSQSTDPGLFEILYKQRNTTLRGSNLDGSPYASPVSYWIPITWLGIGFHDSPWQPESMYGNSEAFKTIGSHGCINTSPSVMPQVWDLTYDKMPVVIWGDIYG